LLFTGQVHISDGERAGIRKFWNQQDTAEVEFNYVKTLISRERWCEMYSCFEFTEEEMKFLESRWNSIAQEMYIPSNFVVLDESMIPFKGENPHHVFIIRKPHSNGTKVWSLVDYHRYFYNTSVYRRDRTKGQKVNSGPPTIPSNGSSSSTSSQHNSSSSSNTGGGNSTSKKTSAVKEKTVDTVLRMASPLKEGSVLVADSYFGSPEAMIKLARRKIHSVFSCSTTRPTAIFKEHLIPQLKENGDHTSEFGSFDVDGRDVNFLAAAQQSKGRYLCTMSTIFGAEPAPSVPELGLFTTNKQGFWLEEEREADVRECSDMEISAPVLEQQADALVGATLSSAGSQEVNSDEAEADEDGCDDESSAVDRSGAPDRSNNTGGGQEGDDDDIIPIEARQVYKKRMISVDAGDRSIMQAWPKIKKPHYSTAIIVWYLTYLLTVNARILYQSAASVDTSSVMGFGRRVGLELVSWKNHPASIKKHGKQLQCKSCYALHDRRHRTSRRCPVCGPICKEAESSGEHKEYAAMKWDHKGAKHFIPPSGEAIRPASVHPESTFRAGAAKARCVCCYYVQGGKNSRTMWRCDECGPVCKNCVANGTHKKYYQ
jgi:hypothetical protein